MAWKEQLERPNTPEEEHIAVRKGKKESGCE
jgi:hypothetical protein